MYLQEVWYGIAVASQALSPLSKGINTIRKLSACKRGPWLCALGSLMPGGRVDSNNRQPGWFLSIPGAQFQVVSNSKAPTLNRL